ncbi:hypothetical protein DRN67_00040 [Candidatus Micrarchaeota archaeon]|nr:MAG: hypothetical protein DRN67_00040 [Candidatus Micrarchaeota archaeon]
MRSIMRKAQVGMEFSMTVAAAVIVFASLLYVAGGVKETLQDSSSRIGAVSMGQRTVMAIDAMQRDACGFECSTTIVLPNRIISMGRSLDYDISLSGTKVVVDYGEGSASVEAGRSLEPLYLEVEEISHSKVVKISTVRV